MLLKIDQEFKNLIPPLTYEERELLEKNIVKEGCRDPIVVWDNTIIDGHNRYDICNKNDLEYKISEVQLSNRNEVINWIIDNQLGKRNVPESVRKYLIGKRYTGEKKTDWNRENQHSKEVVEGKDYHLPEVKTVKTSEKIATQNKVSEKTVRNDETFSESIDKMAESSGKTPMEILTTTKVTQEDAKKIATLEPEVQKKIVDDVSTGQVKSFKEALKPIIKEEGKKNIETKYTPEEIEEKFPSKCSYIPFIPKKSDINMCPCKQHGYCDVNEKWYNIKEINNMEK